MQSSPDTNDLLIRSREGDLEAFRELVEHYQNYAYALSLRLLCNEEDAREVVQDSFIRVWKHLARYNPRVKFTTWFYKIVTNLCYDRIRTRSREGRIFNSDDSHHSLNLAVSHHEPANEVIQHDLLKRIEILTGDLPPRQRVVFVLRDLHDLNIKEVMQITGMADSTVKTNLFYARRKIREKLEEIERMEGNHDKVPAG